MHLVSTTSFDDLDDDNMGERHTAHTLQSPQHLDLVDSGVTTVKDGLLFRFVEYDGVTVAMSLCFLEGVLRTTESADIALSIMSVSGTSMASLRERTVGWLLLVIESVEEEEGCRDCGSFDAIFGGK